MSKSDDAHLRDVGAESETNCIDADSGGVGIDRRTLIKRVGLTTGAAVASSWVLDSFVSTASAATTAWACTSGSVTIAKNRNVFFDVAGGGGGGGSCWGDGYGAAGGKGTRITGQIAGQSPGYTLTVSVGLQGTGGQAPGTPGSGGSGYKAGNSGGAGGAYSSKNGGSGGGGGRA